MFYFDQGFKNDLKIQHKKHKLTCIQVYQGFERKFKTKIKCSYMLNFFNYNLMVRLCNLSIMS